VKAAIKRAKEPRVMKIVFHRLAVSHEPRRWREEEEKGINGAAAGVDVEP